MLISGLLAAVGLLVGTATMTTPAAAQSASPPATADVSDAALVRKLPGFSEGNVTANGVRLHYVSGGKGSPVLLLPGWPQTWWGYHKIMPQLARHHRVIAVDIRGMGASDKPAAGYDKKTMAGDIAGLVRSLGLGKVAVVGHDIGSMVAYSFAANHPDLTSRVVLLDVAPPDASLAKWPLLPGVGTFGDKVGDGSHAYAWWFAYHQVPELHARLAVDGRIRIEQDWFFHYLLKDDASVDAFDRDVFAAAYGSADAIRAGDGWYQAFPQDIIDDEGYAPLTMPVLALGGPGYSWLASVLPAKAKGVKVVRIANSGHFIPDEVPDELLRQLDGFLR
jgi:pimeloyl-ACP methyl ester carboxylesterase